MARTNATRGRDQRPSLKEIAARATAEAERQAPGVRIRLIFTAHGLPEKIRTEIFPGSGHMVQLEAHSKVNQVIRLFWEAS